MKVKIYLLLITGIGGLSFITACTSISTPTHQDWDILDGHELSETAEETSEVQDSGKEQQLDTHEETGDHLTPYDAVDEREEGLYTEDDFVGLDEEVTEDTEVEVQEKCPGGTGCQCEGDDECYSGVCVEDNDGVDRCAAPCESQRCPEGYSCTEVGEHRACIWRFAGLCRPCATDETCELFTGDSRLKCVDMGDGFFCSLKCNNGDCPEGYECRELSDGGSYCIPKDGQCKCTSAASQKHVSGTCRRSNEWGSCTGQWYCGDDGLSSCDAPVPSKEVCNNLDDNCNGQTDEGNLEPPADFSCPDKGVCKGHTILPQCIDGKWKCDLSGIKDYSPHDDNCDCLDNDCDGSTDEEKPCRLYYPDSDHDGIIDKCDPDIDGDGIPNDRDNCPFAANPNQDNVCAGDKDKDGWQDNEDNCPTVFNPSQKDTDKDGIGDACDDDLDNDGYKNSEDCAPLDPQIHPDAQELCNSIDDNCNNIVDEGCNGSGNNAVYLLFGASAVSSGSSTFSIGGTGISFDTKGNFYHAVTGGITYQLYTR